MPRVRPPVLDMDARTYAESKKRLIADQYHKQQRTLDQAAEYRRERELAMSDVDLTELRDSAMRRGMDPVEAVRFADRIAKLREELSR